VEGLRVGRERKKHILTRFAARLSDLLLHPGIVVREKRNIIAISVEKRIAHLVRDSLLVLHLRII
jgi:hypothetical protein